MPSPLEPKVITREPNGVASLDEVLAEAKRRKKAEHDCHEAFQQVVGETIAPAFRDAATMAREAGVIGEVDIDETTRNRITLRTKLPDAEMSYVASTGAEGGNCVVSLRSPVKVGMTYAPENVRRRDVDREVALFFECILLCGFVPAPNP